MASIARTLRFYRKRRSGNETLPDGADAAEARPEYPDLAVLADHPIRAAVADGFAIARADKLPELADP